MEGIAAKWLNALSKMGAIIGTALYSDLRGAITNRSKVLPKIVGVLIIIIVFFTAGILCVYEYIREYEELTKKYNMEIINALAEKEGMMAIEVFERYRTLEEKSYSHDPNKINIENKYKVGWEFLSAIDFKAYKKNIRLKNSIDILKPNFTYKQSMVIKNISIKKNIVNGMETKENEEIKKPIEVEKVLLPLEIDTFYKKMVYEYEIKTLISRTKEGDSIITKVIQKEVIKDGYPIEFENVSSRLLPYLKSLGIEGEDAVRLIIANAKKQVRSSNEAFEYISEYLDKQRAQ